MLIGLGLLKVIAVIHCRLEPPQIVGAAVVSVKAAQAMLPSTARRRREVVLLKTREETAAGRPEALLERTEPRTISKG